MKPRIPKRVIAAAVAGNALEFFDFGLYAYFAVYIGKAFFPAASPMGSLMLSVAAFGVGFVTRPVGGVLIGAYADQRGRKPAMLLAVALITIGTVGLAVTPTYESIGLAAPMIVVTCRMLQGLALGGEVGPSTAFLLESAPADRRGFYGSWQLASQGAATLIGGSLGVAISWWLSPTELQAWGWRLPFGCSLLLLPIALYLRRNMVDTVVATSAQAKPEPALRLTSHKKLLTLAVFVISGGTVANYVSNYMTTYAITTLKLPASIAMGATVLTGAVSLVLAPIGGWISDHIGRKPVFLMPRLLMVIFILPAFDFLIAHPSPLTLLAVTAFLAGLNSLSSAGFLVAIPELLPRRIRATGFSISYAIAVSLFGGTTQLVITWLIDVTGNAAAPAWYLVATGSVAVIAAAFLPESRTRAL